MATMAVLLVVGLAVADVIVYTQVRAFLSGRLDEQLAVAQRQGYAYLTFVHRAGVAPTSDGLDDRISPDVYVLVLGRQGTVETSRPSGSTRHPDPLPALPARLRVAAAPASHIFGRHAGPYHPNPNSIDVSSRSDTSARYRLTAVAVPQGVLVTAISLNATEATLGLLAQIELVASVAVVLVVLGLGFLFIRRGLRPLEDIAETAGAIASGDLTRRVPDPESGTEVGRVGEALNVMLAHIEEAFRTRAAGEARLRQFVADASHELRTPLTSILGYAELLRRGALDDDESTDRALQRIEREARRMSGLVDDLLLLARLDQGRALAADPVDLATVCAEAVEDARALDPARRLELAVAGPVVVLGDRDRLGQVAHNLVRNALAHTPEGSAVRVEVAAEDGRGVVRVLDRGPGLDADQRARVFDRFYRADSARTGAGTGLGLAIVAAIAGALGGMATVAPRAGGGSVFAVTVPLAPSAPAPVRPAAGLSPPALRR